MYLNLNFLSICFPFLNRKYATISFKMSVKILLQNCAYGHLAKSIKVIKLRIKPRCRPIEHFLVDKIATNKTNYEKNISPFSFNGVIF